MRGWTANDVPGELISEGPDEAPQPLRTNRSNTGKVFEKEIETTAAGYHNRRIAVLRKVDPPVRLIYYFDKTTQTKKTRTIFMANPFLDFVGIWSARGGRMLLVEAKSTATHRLPLNRDGGLTKEQVATIKTWRIAGAAVCVVWQWAGKVCLWTPEMLRAAEDQGDKSLEFEAGLSVERGEGNVVWDFLPVLAKSIWPELANKLDTCE